MLLRLASSSIPGSAPASPIVAADARRRAPDAVSMLQRVMLVVILLTAAGLRWWRIGAASLWTDELLSLEVSSGVAWRYVDPPRNVVLEPSRGLSELRADGGWRQLVRSLRNSGHPPLYFAVLRVWRELWGTDDDAALRSLSAVLSMLAIVFAFDAVRLMHSTRAAVWAAALLAINGLQIQYAQETRGYAMFVAEMMAACAVMARIERFGATSTPSSGTPGEGWGGGQPRAPHRASFGEGPHPALSRRTARGKNLAWRGIRSRFGAGTWRVIALTACVAAMLLTHYLGFAVVAALLIYAAVRLHGPQRAGALAGIGAAVALVLLAWGPMMWTQMHSQVAPLSWLSDPAPGGGWRVIERVAQLPMRFFIDIGDNAGVMTYAGAALFLLPLVLLRRHPRLLLWALLLWLIVGVVAIGDATRGTAALSIPRYTLGAGTAATILAAVVAASASRAWVRWVAPAALVLASALTLPQAYERYRPDYRALASYLDSTCRDDGTVVLYPTAHEDWYPGVLNVALAHYSHRPPRPVVLLYHPADAALERQLARRGVVDVVSGSLAPEQIFPDGKAIDAEFFPAAGAATRVTITRPSVASR